MAITGKLPKLLACTIAMAMAIALSACQDKNTKNDNSVSIQTPEEPTEVVRDTIALENEVGFEKTPGIVFDDMPRHDFENFYMSGEGVDVTRNVAEALSEKWMVDSVAMDYNTFIGLYRTDPVVEPGSNYVAKIRMATQPGKTATAVLQLVSFCTSDNREGSQENITVTEQPQTFSVSHTFENAQGCALFRITNTTEGGATLLTESASLNKGY